MTPLKTRLLEVFLGSGSWNALWWRRSCWCWRSLGCSGLWVGCTWVGVVCVTVRWEELKHNWHKWTISDQKSLHFREDNSFLSLHSHTYYNNEVGNGHYTQHNSLINKKNERMFIAVRLFILWEKWIFWVILISALLNLLMSMKTAEIWFFDAGRCDWMLRFFFFI